MTGSIRRVGRRRVVSDPTGERSGARGEGGGEDAGKDGGAGGKDGVGGTGAGNQGGVGAGAVSGLEQTTDDTDDGWGEAPGRSVRDEWLRAQRPPHWE